MTMFNAINNQKGAFSPFMFGMLMGVAVFSASMNHWAKREIVDIDEANRISNREKAIEIKKALENAMLTENIDSENPYSEDFTMQRAQKFLSGSTGKTRSGDDAVLSTVHDSGSFKTSNKKIMIAVTDDQLVRDDVGGLAGAEAMKDYNSTEGSVVMFDSESIRLEQIKESKQRLQREVSQIYVSYTTYGYKFPTTDEYKSQINAATGNKDVWGQSFKYDRKSDKLVILSFTTPWGYTYKTKLDMN
ncbi:MAG: hypothetical protein ACI9TY_001824 [Alphaproteobacteria bacterium]|jgi:hypothetical protein